MSKYAPRELINAAGADECRALLHEAGLTQSGLGRILDISAITVCRWCNGRLAFPQYVRAYLELLIRYNKEKRVTRSLRLDDMIREEQEEQKRERSFI